MAKNKLHLSLRHKKLLLDIFKKNLPDVEVWAYGSRINNKSHPASDLDLVLRSPGLNPISSQKLLALVEDLKESSIPFFVEARDWALLPKSFHQEIEKNYIVLFKESTELSKCKDSV